MIKITLLILLILAVPFIITLLAFIWRDKVRTWRKEDAEYQKQLKAEAMRELKESFEAVNAVPVSDYFSSRSKTT